MKKHLQLALATTLTLSAASAFAQAAAAPAAPAATPEWTFAGNLGIFSDYRFRGISQTNKYPAIQGGVDLGHKSGFYVGNWNSNVDSAMYNGANIEMDFYGGWKTTIDAFGLDLGAIYYYYPGSGAAGTQKIDNTELYIAGSYGPFAIKWNYAVSDFFSAPNSSGSSYLDLGFNYDLGSNWGVVAHYGYQYLKGSAVVTQIGATTTDNNISDWKLGVTYTVDGWVIGLAYIATNRDLSAGTAAYSTRNISGNTGVLSVTKSF